MNSNNSSKFNKNAKPKQASNNGIMQTFDNRTESTKKQVILNRKRSTPAFNSDKSP